MTASRLYKALIIFFLLCSVFRVYASGVAVLNESSCANYESDYIVAYVNDGVITKYQVMQKVNDTLLKFKAHRTTPPKLSELKHQVLKNLILERIQLDLADQYRVGVSHMDIDNALNNILKANKLNLDQFKQVLIANGDNYKHFMSQLHDEIILNKLKQGLVVSRVLVTKQDVDLVLNSSVYRNQKYYDLGAIVVTIPEGANATVLSNKRQLIESALFDLKSKVNFDTVSAKYSDAPNALSGGDMGFRSASTLPPEILNSVQNLNVGEISDIVRLPVGFFIFKMLGIKDSQIVTPVKQYHVRHILIKINNVVDKDEAYQKIMYIKNLLNQDIGNPGKLNSDFAKYAKEYSDDNSALKGGDIGWISVGQTVPQFESVVLSSPIDSVSDPVRTMFGYHLIQVLGTRMKRESDSINEAQIRNELMQSKVNMLYMIWLRNIRATAYVKIIHDY